MYTEGVRICDIVYYVYNMLNLVAAQFLLRVYIEHRDIMTTADSLASFKSRLKTHLFSQTFRPACS